MKCEQCGSRNVIIITPMATIRLDKNGKYLGDSKNEPQVYCNDCDYSDYPDSVVERWNREGRH